MDNLQSYELKSKLTFPITGSSSSIDSLAPWKKKKKRRERERKEMGGGVGARTQDKQKMDVYILMLPGKVTRRVM
jgi:hypothetical protein